ncbi:MAG: hypothetical protein U5M51_10950 [Emticicia sp.]|nr:hypothetical protein [Emticicia sp.]
MQNCLTTKNAQGEKELQQLALTPEESIKHIWVPADFDLSLFAAEPYVTQRLHYLKK